jgi:hypothetical protein
MTTQEMWKITVRYDASGHWPGDIPGGLTLDEGCFELEL